MSAVIAHSTTGGKRGAEARSLRSARVTLAHTILGTGGIDMSHSKITRLVQRFEHEAAPLGWSFFDFVATAAQLDVERRERLRAVPAIARAIVYADPTGETAVRNVMGGGSRG